MKVIANTADLDKLLSLMGQLNKWPVDSVEYKNITQAIEARIAEVPHMTTDDAKRLGVEVFDHPLQFAGDNYACN